MCMALIFTMNNDGWSREWNREGLRHATIAKWTQRSLSRTTHLLLAMQERKVIEARGGTRPGGAEYRILPEEKRLARNSTAKPRLRLPSLRMRASDGAVRMTIPGRGIAELMGEPTIKLGTPDRMAVTVTGADLSSVRIPEGAKVEIAEGLHLLPIADVEKPAKRAKSGHLLPVAEVENAGNGGVSRHDASEKGANGHLLPATDVPRPAQGREVAPVVLSCRGGKVKVWPHRGRRLTTEGERRRIPQMSPQELVELFAQKGVRALACEEAIPIHTLTHSERIALDGAPTGTWARLLERLRRSVNAHTFSTWFGVTREVGRRDGRIVVLVPSATFARNLSKRPFADYVAAGLADIGARDAQIEYRLRDELPEEIPARESLGAGAAGKQQNQSQRRIA